MKPSTPFGIILAAIASLVAAAPTPGVDDFSLIKRSIIERLSAERKGRLAKRQSVTSGADDVTVLNFALTLEHLENAFYSQALAKFSAADFNSAGYTGAYPVLQQVASDEAQHVSFLTSALSAAGAIPVQACNYTFPYTTVGGFLGLSQVLEGVGVSAYLGAAGSINNTAYLTAAGSILTVEARHNAFISFLNGYSPFPSPEDTPQSAASVVTLATSFFVSCPTGSAPAIEGHPALNLTTASAVVGGNITVTPTNTTALASFTGTVYCGFASGLGAGFSVWANNTCSIPTSNVTAGQTYVVLTSGPSVADDSVLAGPAILELGIHNYSVSLSGAAASEVTASGGATAASATTKTGGASTLEVGGGVLAVVLGVVGLFV